MTKRIILAGGSGFIGESLVPVLIAIGYEVAVLTRGPSTQQGSVRYAHWDGKTTGDWAELLDDAAAVVNLTGRSINCRHTPEYRREIIDSRVNSVRVLGQAIAQCERPPTAFVQAAGIGIYGDQSDRWCDENVPHGDDFVAQVCELWEAAFTAVAAPATRKVLLRLGVVLGPNGGFLKVLSKLTRLFLGGHVGSGRQFISWIHIADLSRMILWAIEREEIAGVFNATAPNPVTNAEFMRELRRALHRPWSPPVPKFAAQLGSWLMGTEASLALVSQRGAPKHFLDKGFKFDFPELRPALADLLQ
jgi:uncharacterized protein (TIGR01777 family)